MKRTRPNVTCANESRLFWELLGRHVWRRRLGHCTPLLHRPHPRQRHQEGSVRASGGFSDSEPTPQRHQETRCRFLVQAIAALSRSFSTRGGVYLCAGWLSSTEGARRMTQPLQSWSGSLERSSTTARRRQLGSVSGPGHISPPRTLRSAITAVACAPDWQPAPGIYTAAINIGQGCRQLAGRRRPCWRPQVTATTAGPSNQPRPPGNGQ